MRIFIHGIIGILLSQLAVPISLIILSFGDIEGIALPSSWMLIFSVPSSIAIGLPLLMVAFKWGGINLVRAWALAIACPIFTALITGQDMFYLGLIFSLLGGVILWSYFKSIGLTKGKIHSAYVLASVVISISLFYFMGNLLLNPADLEKESYKTMV